MTEETEYLEGSGNVFQDLGFDNPQEELTKAKLASTIYDIIEDRKLTHKKAGVILGINQSKVFALKDGRLAGFSMERLFSFLRALDQDIDIVVHPKSENKSSGINLTTAYP